MFSLNLANVAQSSKPVSIYADGSVSVCDLWTNWTVPSRKRNAFYSVNSTIPGDQASLLDDLHLCVEELLTEVSLFNSPVSGPAIDAAEALAFHARAVEIVNVLVVLPPVTSGRQPVRVLTKVQPTPRGHRSEHPDVPARTLQLLNRLHGISEEWIWAVGDYRRLVNKGRRDEANESYAASLHKYADEVMSMLADLQTRPSRRTPASRSACATQL